MKIKQIMTKRVISVEDSVKILEVAQLMTKYKIHGIPVTQKRKLRGIITESDFFVKDLPNLYLPSYINFLKDVKFADKINNSENSKVKKILNATAKDIMSENCISLNPDSNIKEMLKIIKEKYLFTFPVVDKKNNLVGIITQADIIKLL